MRLRRCRENDKNDKNRDSYAFVKSLRLIRKTSVKSGAKLGRFQNRVFFLDSPTLFKLKTVRARLLRHGVLYNVKFKTSNWTAKSPSLNRHRAVTVDGLTLKRDTANSAFSSTESSIPGRLISRRSNKKKILSKSSYIDTTNVQQRKLRFFPGRGSTIRRRPGQTIRARVSFRRLACVEHCADASRASSRRSNYGCTNLPGARCRRRREREIEGESERERRKTTKKLKNFN